MLLTFFLNGGVPLKVAVILAYSLPKESLKVNPSEKGFLTHYASGKAFPENPGELLVVPAFLPHTGKSGEKENLIVWVFVRI